MSEEHDDGRLVLRLTVSVVFSTFSLCKFMKSTQSKFRTMNLPDNILSVKTSI